MSKELSNQFKSSTAAPETTRTQTFYKTSDFVNT